VLYDTLHKRWSGAAVFMGVCRGLVYVTAAAATGLGIHWETLAPLALILMVYVVAFTFIAQRETGGELGVRYPAVFVVVATPFAVMPVTGADVRIAALGLALSVWLGRTIAWLRRDPPQIKRTILHCIACIALLDAFILVALGHGPLAAGAAICYLVTIVAHRRIAGT